MVQDPAERETGMEPLEPETEKGLPLRKEPTADGTAQPPGPGAPESRES